MSKLIKCKTCGGEIARTAKVCPHCGAKNKYQSPSQAVGCLIVLILIVVVFGALSDKKDEVKNVKKTLSELTDQEKEVKEVSKTLEEKEKFERQEYFMNRFRSSDGAIGPVCRYVMMEDKDIERNSSRFQHIHTRWTPVDDDWKVYSVNMEYGVLTEWNSYVTKKVHLFCTYTGEVGTDYQSLLESVSERAMLERQKETARLIEEQHKKEEQRKKEREEKEKQLEQTRKEQEALMQKKLEQEKKEQEAQIQKQIELMQEDIKRRQGGGSTTQPPKTSSQTKGSTQTKKSSSSTTGSTQTKTNTKNTSTGNKSTSTKSTPANSNRTSSSSKNKY